MRLRACVFLQLLRRRRCFLMNGSPNLGGYRCSQGPMLVCFGRASVWKVPWPAHHYASPQREKANDFSLAVSDLPQAEDFFLGFLSSKIDAEFVLPLHIGTNETCVLVSRLLNYIISATTHESLAQNLSPGLRHGKPELRISGGMPLPLCR